jgi:hypothetical protein
MKEQNEERKEVREDRYVKEGKHEEVDGEWPGVSTDKLSRIATRLFVRTGLSV